MQFRISEVFGGFCVDPADGERLCTEISTALDRGEKVCLDFTDVQVVTSSFLNPALGCLYCCYTDADLADRLTFSGLDAIDQELVNDVRQNAVRFYSAPPAQQERLIQAAADPFGNC